jgi:hypothetical protein
MFFVVVSFAGNISTDILDLIAASVMNMNVALNHSAEVECTTLSATAAIYVSYS